MISLRSNLVVGLALALGSALQAATYEVAQQNPQASDEGPGTVERPWKTIAKAAEKMGPGDVVVIRGGVYRERVVVKTSGTAQAPICFEAAPGEHVILTGADRLTGWQRADEARPIYSTAWPHKFIGWNRNMTHPDDEYHRLIGRCEQVVVNGYLLRQVLNPAQFAPGTFFVDVTNKTLSVWDTASRDLNKAHVEVSVRQEIFRVEGDHVQLRGLRFRYAANMAQHGAVVLAGRYDAMEDCVVESMNSSGAAFTGADAVVRRCVFRDNGQLGFGASRAHRLLLTECLVENNNTKGFDRGWEAGGNKLALCRDVVLERSRFVRNRGNGIWFDIGNTNCTVRQCLIADNEDAGIFYEISFSLLAQDNVIVGNGFAATPGAWGAQAGISLSSSPGCVIERNLIAGNREGFNFREQTRTTPTIDDRAGHPVWNHDQLIRHNLIVLNRDAQVWGWFDVKDNRHWPASSTPTKQAESAAKPGDIAAAYVAADSKAQPQGLTLEKLRLRFDHNVYFAAPGQGWFKWGPTWARHESYAGLSEFQSGLGIDADSQVLDPGFADVRQLDFRLRAEAMALLQKNYPQGPVPGVTLGVRE
jgi:hypothetical protein